MALSHVSRLLEVPGYFSITVLTITVSLNCSLVHSPYTKIFEFNIVVEQG